MPGSRGHQYQALAAAVDDYPAAFEMQGARQRRADDSDLKLEMGSADKVTSKSEKQAHKLARAGARRRSYQLFNSKEHWGAIACMIAAEVVGAYFIGVALLSTRVWIFTSMGGATPAAIVALAAVTFAIVCACSYVLLPFSGGVFNAQVWIALWIYSLYYGETAFRELVDTWNTTDIKKRNESGVRFGIYQPLIVALLFGLLILSGFGSSASAALISGRSLTRENGGVFDRPDDVSHGRAIFANIVFGALLTWAAASLKDHKGALNWPVLNGLVRAVGILALTPITGGSLDIALESGIAITQRIGGQTVQSEFGFVLWLGLFAGTGIGLLLGVISLWFRANYGGHVTGKPKPIWKL